MDLKHNQTDSPDKPPVKKFKLESKQDICPHSVKCYRRNPHHFKEYDHPHLNPYLTVTDIPKFPTDFVQDKQVYLEQLIILRDIKKLTISAVKNKTESQTLTAESSSSQLNKESENFLHRKQVVTNYQNPNSFKTIKDMPYGKTMKEKLNFCKPYNLFYTKVPEAKATLFGYNCIHFSDIICPSIGVLVKSLQINFMIDISWLIEQYKVHNLHTSPVTIIHGYEFPMMNEYIAKFLPNVKAHQVNMKDPFGVHHSKIGIYKYENGDIRIVVSTANLYYEDWNHYNQALWLSPPLPKMDDSKQDFECPGPTGFKTDFLSYMQSYNLGILKDWIALVSRADFSNVKVFFTCSIPGKHFPRTNGCHVHRMSDLLTKHCDLKKGSTDNPDSWGIIAQSSSLGSFGKSADEWLRPVLLRALAGHKSSNMLTMKRPTLNLIYPTKNNVLKSHFGPVGGGCLPYSKSVNDKQLWLKDFLHIWKADELGRSLAMPHIKSYCRISPCLTKLAWCLITSANISKAAWGSKGARDGSTYIRSYEAGVLFMPHMFDEDYLCLKTTGHDKNLFPLMYDLPLQSYNATDEPWCN